MEIKKIYVQTIVILVLFIFPGLTSCTKKSVEKIPASTSSPSPITANNTIPAISPTANTFQEMTIPYLRQREYRSSLSNLQELQKYPEYTSFLTSYTSDNLRINALLTRPNETAPQGGWPAIVFVHGYIPPAQYKTTEKYIDYVNYLARNNFVVLKIDLRGHGNSEGDAGGGYYSSDYVIDTLNAYSALQSTEFINPTKIGLWGHSMAGNILLRSFAARPEIPAVDIWAGAGYTYLDLKEYHISDYSYQPQPSSAPSQQKRQALFNTHGQFDPNIQFWQEVAPTNYLSELKGAIQLNHAVDDNVVNIKYSRNLNSLLDSTTVIHELKEYPTGGHNISGSSFSKAMQNTVEFYKKYLAFPG